MFYQYCIFKIWFVFSATSEAIVRQAIEHVYPLVLPFRRNKLSENLLIKARESQALAQNTEEMKSSENHEM